MEIRNVTVASSASPDPAPGSVARSGSAGFSAQLAESSPVREHVADHLTRIAETERTLRRAEARIAAGASLSDADLIELQRTMYSYSQDVAVATSVIDKVAGALKQLASIQL